jgi:EAL domain-containing protein (putative c-di-GMP-specific phosphodiesterase class I)
MQPASIEEVKQALREDAFVFFYQPKISFVTGRISGGEALIRWRKADGSLVPPGLFIPVAEECGFISEITQHMFPHLLQDYLRIKDVVPDSSVAFNVSASDLEREALSRAIEDALDRGAIPARNLTIEITEATALSSNATMRETVQRLAARGVDLAMDDFGTGYATLDAIRQLPFSTLKVDQGIVREMRTSDRAAMLVHANVLLAQVLGMRTVAEGVETEAIYNAVLHSGCREGQGYFMSRPQPLDDYIALLRSGRTWASSQVGVLRSVLMSHVIELRRVMDRIYSARWGSGGNASPMLKGAQKSALSVWYEGDGQALRGMRAFESMKIPSTILHETYSIIEERLATGADAQELSDAAAKLAHYSVVLIGDLLRLESELLLKDIRQGVRP